MDSTIKYDTGVADGATEAGFDNLGSVRKPLPSPLFQKRSLSQQGNQSEWDPGESQRPSCCIDDSFWGVTAI